MMHWLEKGMWRPMHMRQGVRNETGTPEQQIRH